MPAGMRKIIRNLRVLHNVNVQGDFSLSFSILVISRLFNYYCAQAWELKMQQEKMD